MEKDKGLRLSKDFLYGVNNVDDYTATNITYIGREDKNGKWWIVKMDETGSFPILGHATKINNNGYTTYDEAWNARTDLIYGKYSEAF